MNENLNLCEILKDVPVGTKLWSPLYGKLALESIIGNNEDYPIRVRQLYGPNDEIGDLEMFTKEGFHYCDYEDTECVLFPSREQRDWSKFEVPKQKVKVTLHPFARVLIRDFDDDKWRAELFSHYDVELSYVCTYGAWEQCIPYNEDTDSLLGTSDPCPIDYDISFSKDYQP